MFFKCCEEVTGMCYCRVPKPTFSSVRAAVIYRTLQTKFSDVDEKLFCVTAAHCSWNYFSSFQVWMLGAKCAVKEASPRKCRTWNWPSIIIRPCTNKWHRPTQRYVLPREECEYLLRGSRYSAAFGSLASLKEMGLLPMAAAFSGESGPVPGCSDAQ